MPSLRANIGKLYALSIAQSAIFHEPILVLYFTERGLSLTEFFLVQSAASFAIILLMIPAGYLADRWGRRNVTILSALALITSVFLLAFGTMFWQFFLSEIFRGIFRSLQFGAMNALTYDTLLALKEEGRSRTVFGRQYALQFCTLALASVVGGFLALRNLQTPVLATIPFVGLYLLVSLFLKEPPVHTAGERISIATLRSCMRHPDLWFLLLFQGVLGALIFWLAFSSQAYLQAVGVSLVFFGGFYAIFQISMAGSSLLATIATRRFSDRSLLLIMTPLILSSIMMLGLDGIYTGFIFLIIGVGSWGMLKTVVMDVLNRMTDSTTRATVISLQLFTIHALFAIIGPLLGLIMEGGDIHRAFLIAGLGGTACIAALWLPLRRSLGRK